MATFSSILIPAQVPSTKIAGLATTTSSVEQALGANVIFAINADQDITIKFGLPGLAAATANDFRVPANSTMVFDVGSHYTSFRCFNLSGTTTANIYIQFLSKF